MDKGLLVWSALPVANSATTTIPYAVADSLTMRKNGRHGILRYGSCVCAGPGQERTYVRVGLRQGKWGTVELPSKSWFSVFAAGRSPRTRTGPGRGCCWWRCSLPAMPWPDTIWRLRAGRHRLGDGNSCDFCSRCRASVHLFFAAVKWDPSADVGGLGLGV